MIDWKWREKLGLGGDPLGGDPLAGNPLGGNPLCGNYVADTLGCL